MINLGRALLAFITLWGCASRGEVQSGYAERFGSEFRRLGASAGKGRCYSEKLASGDRATLTETARILESANDPDDLKARVLNANEPTRQAFIRAKFGCSLAL